MCSLSLPLLKGEVLLLIASCLEPVASSSEVAAGVDPSSSEVVAGVGPSSSFEVVAGVDPSSSSEAVVGVDPSSSY